MASRVAVALDKRTPLPRLFLDEVLHKYFKWVMDRRKVFHLKRYTEFEVFYANCDRSNSSFEYCLIQIV